MKTYTAIGVRKIKDRLAWRIDVVDVTTGAKAQVQLSHKDALEIGIAIATSLYSRESRTRSKRVRDDGNLLNTMMSGVVPKAFDNWLRLEGEGEVE